MWFQKKRVRTNVTDDHYSQTLGTEFGTIVREFIGAGRGNSRHDFRTSVSIRMQSRDASHNWIYTLENVIEPHQPWCEDALLFEWNASIVAACGEHIVLLNLETGSVVWDRVWGNSVIVSMCLHDGSLYVLYDYCGFESPDGMSDDRNTSTSNLVKLAFNGDVIWRASRRWDREDYTGFNIEKDRLFATTWDSFCCTIDMQSGVITSTVFTK